MVLYASPFMLFVLDGRCPNDQGTGSPTWKATDWSFNPDSSGGGNFALEELAVPLAWGCETGSAATKVAVLEQTSPEAILPPTFRAECRPFRPRTIQPSHLAERLPV